MRKVIFIIVVFIFGTSFAGNHSGGGTLAKVSPQSAGDEFERPTIIRVNALDWDGKVEFEYQGTKGPTLFWSSERDLKAEAPEILDAVYRSIDEQGKWVEVIDL